MVELPPTTSLAASISARAEPKQKELKAVRLTLAYKRLVAAGAAGWTEDAIKAALDTPATPPAPPVAPPGTTSPTPDSSPTHCGLMLYDAFDAYVKYEEGRAPNETTYAFSNGQRIRVRRLKKMMPNKMLAGVREDFEATMLKVADAVNDAPDGHLIDGSEEQVGKLAIAMCLVPCENPHHVLDATKRGGSWYHHLFEQMSADSVLDFSHNAVSFVTFNYDRFLEFFFHNSLQHLYAATPQQVAQTMRCIPIIHLHGQLGSLADNPYTGYITSNVPTDILLRASDGIKIIHELADGASEPQFQQAHGLFEEAERILILGFGFHPVNLKRLKLSGLQNKAILATSHGLTDADTAEYNRQLNGVVFVPKTNLDFLRETGAFYKKTEYVSRAGKLRASYFTASA